MKLRIHKCVSGKIKQLLLEAFPLVTARLGISGYEGTIELHIGSAAGEGGSTGPKSSRVNVRRLDAGRRPIEFGMYLRPDSLAQMFPVFCHEMIHIKQWVTGQLGAKFVDGDVQQMYYSVAIDADSIPYREQPWEKEAFDGMHDLAECVLGQLVRQKEKV